MPLLKRKQEKTTVLSVRVPLSIKAEMDHLRQLADDSGFDLTGSLTDAVLRWIKQIREELNSTSGARATLSARYAGGPVVDGNGARS